MAALPWTIAPMTVAWALCALLTSIVWLRSRPPGWLFEPTLLPMLAWLAALALAAWFAEDRAASLPRMSKGLLAALVPMAAFHCADRREGARALATLLGSAVLAALLGLGTWIGSGASFEARAQGPVGHHMTFGGQVLLWVSLAAGVCLAARSAAWRLAAGGAALAGAVTLAATFTRSAWLGLIAAVATMLAVLRPRWLAALAGIVLLLVALAPAPFRDRFVSGFDPSHVTNLERRHMWEAGLAMFRDHPVTGVGLQDLIPAYDRYRSPDSRERTGHLHSVPIQIAASMGVLGLAAFAVLYGSLLRAAGKGLPAQLARGGLAAGVRVGVFGGLVGFLVAGLFEWNFGDEELLDLLYVLAGMAWAARAWPEEGNRA